MTLRNDRILTLQPYYIATLLKVLKLLELLELHKLLKWLKLLQLLKLTELIKGTLSHDKNFQYIEDLTPLNTAS